MHVPDGFLSPLVTVPAYCVAAPLWAWAARRNFGSDRLQALPALGALTALALVLQTIMIPVPGGTSVHLVGTTLLAVLFGPLSAFVCESLVLAIQALVLGAGGVTVLGVNALALGLLGPLCAWGTHRALSGLGEKIACFGAAYLSTQVSALAVAGALGLQHLLDPAYFPTPFPVAAAAIVLPGLLVTGLVEGAFTVVALGLLRKGKVLAPR